MDAVSTEVVQLLRYLLPGFLAAWVFYGLTSHPKPSEFERVVQALIFTLVVQALVFCEQQIALLIGHVVHIRAWDEHAELLSSVLTAPVLGLCFAYFSNSDRFHAIMRKWKITRETSHPSEWFGVFATKTTFVVLHLNDERRIYGWPTEWPSEPTKGHFSLQQASWLLEDGSERQLTGVDCILIRAEDVKRVEFMNRTWENANE